ncbi:putative ankyrin repeat protein [Colletotrichum sp. SAR 10_75]|nr:putative ankyrin repeat protein [Colletotrichum sp. SAR 10_75]
MSAIHCAAFSNEPEVLRHLVDLGISVDTADGCGANILYHAVESRSLDMVRYALTLQTNPSASVYIVDRMHNKHRVEGICQWVAQFSSCNSPNYLDAVIVMLAERGGDSVFWLDEESSHTEGEDVEHDSIRPKSMTINVISKYIRNPFKDFAKRGWVSQLLQGAIATYQPTEAFNDLKKEIMAFFWHVIGDSSCGAGSLETILQSYDSLDLTELIDGDLRPRDVKTTNYAGQLGTVALHMILTEYSLDPNSKAIDVEVVSGVADMMRILGEHGAWELSESETQHAVRTYVNLVRKITYWDGNAAKLYQSHTLMMTTRLTTMPPEILLAIADLLPQAVLRALSLINKRLYDVINPVLYAQSVKNEAPDITVLAARDGNLDTLKMAASFGADMNRVYWVPVPTWAKPEKIQSTAPKTGYGVCWATPLHVAAAYGHYDVLKWLLAEGVDVDVPGKLLCGCLSLCEMRDHFGTSSDAWQTRINLDCVPDVAGTWTPLHLAICRGNQSIARLLISRGASLDIRYNRRMNIPRTHGVSTLFYSESCDSRIRMTHFGSTGIEESSNDDLDHRFTTQVLEQAENHNRMHAVHTAASSGQKEILHYLVAKGADINNLDGSNGNALHYALSESDTDMCKLVLDLGVDTATPIDFSEYNIDGSCIMSVVVWAVKYCLGKTDVISRALSHIAERGDSFWKVDEGSGKAMVISSIFDSGCYDDGLLMQPQYNRWISEFLQGAILTCDSSNVGNLEEDLFIEVSVLL